MTAVDEELTTRLKAFLSAFEAATSNGHTLEKLYVVVEHLASHLTEHVQNDRLKWQQNSEQHTSAISRLTSLEVKLENILTQLKASTQNSLSSKVEPSP
jgi:hypothetical protein